MQGLVCYLNSIYENCNIEFNVYINEKEIFKTKGITNKLHSQFFVWGNKFVVEVDKEHKDLIKLIRFCIEDKFKEHYNNNTKTVYDLLEGELVFKEKIDKLPFLEEKSYIVVISINNKLDEAIEVLKGIYGNSNCVILKYKDSIVLIGEFEDINEHVSSIHETINIDIYENAYICYSKVGNFEKLKEKYKKCISKIFIGKKYLLENDTYNEEVLIFEEIIENINEDTVLQIKNKFEKIFSKLDEDLIKTIDMFFRLDLNLSEAAKRLYIHRNTLIYRLDKIVKYTGYDIRNFSDACLFKMAFSIYRQNDV